MKAVDTNILARYITQDDPREAELAEQALMDGVFVSLTVLLETAWLLRSRYGFTRIEVGDAIDVILSLASVDVADSDLIRWSLDRSLAGADIADMLHIVAARHRDAFVTLDRGVVGYAGADCPVPVETLIA